MDSDSESDDDVPLVSKTSRAKNATKGKNRADQSEDSDVPLGVKVKIEKRAEVEDKAVRKEEKVSKKKPRKEDSDGDEQPVKKKRSSIVSPSSRKKQANGVEKGESKDHDALTIRKPADEKVKPGVLPSALTPIRKPPRSSRRRKGSWPGKRRKRKRKLLKKPRKNIGGGRIRPKAMAP